jgi:hypothetical protein
VRSPREVTLTLKTDEESCTWCISSVARPGATAVKLVTGGSPELEAEFSRALSSYLSWIGVLFSSPDSTGI